MASPRLRALPSPFTPAAARSPADRVSEASTPAKEVAIWKRLREAGFDEETVKRRDKSALISYITKLESEVYDYQYNMGLLLLEKKEWTAKYEEAKACAAAAACAYNRDQAAHLSALAEGKRCEESLKKALAIEKGCVADIEKALHDMRAESAETRVAYESKMAEARIMDESAQKKFDEAESMLRAAEYLQAEAIRSQNTASRKLQDVAAREDELRRGFISFQSEFDLKEKELSLQRQSFYDSQKVLHQEQENLREGKALLNKQEEHIFQGTRALGLLEKELKDAKEKLEEDCRTLKVKRSTLDLDLAALATREEAIVRRESLLDKGEREVIILRERVSSQGYDEIQRLSAEHQSSLEKKQQEFEDEVREKRTLFEGEMKDKLAALEVREAELNQKEALIKERESSVELQLSALSGDHDDLSKKLKLLEEKEHNLHSGKKVAEIEMQNIRTEKEQLMKIQVELNKSKSSLEDEKRAMLHAQQTYKLTIAERNELLILETKLKEEIDNFRAKKMELDAEAEKLRAEKEKFEIEWELIDEKRGQVQRETEFVAKEKKIVHTCLKNEHDRIKLEKEEWRKRLKNDMESLSREREEFMSKMECEHSDWLIKVQREREDFVKDINIQRKELENCIHKRREEVESYLREKEENFEREMAKESQHIKSQKEVIAKQLDHVTSVLKKLNGEREEIALDRKQREEEWSEINSSIDVLNAQREKLQKQREMLHADREEICQKIYHLNKLEHLDMEIESKSLFDMHTKHAIGNSKMPIKKCSNKSVGARAYDNGDQEQKFIVDDNVGMQLLSEKPSDNASPPLSATMSWVKKYAGTVFRHSPEKVGDVDYVGNVQSKTKLSKPSLGNMSISSKSNSCEHHHHADGKKVKEDAAEKSSGPTKNNITSFVSGRKRFNSSLSSDPVEYLVTRKHQKMETHKDSATTEEKSPLVGTPKAKELYLEAGQSVNE